MCNCCRTVGLTLVLGCAVLSAFCGGTQTSPSAVSNVSTPTAIGGTANDTPVSEDPPAGTVPPGMPEPPPPGSGSAWLNAIGDTGWCGSQAMPQVAQLLDSLPGDVLLAGDLAYMNGSADDFRRCFDPDFGRLGNRLRPTPGNHEYGTPNAEGYFGYFGTRAGTDRRGYYAFRAGAWNVLMLNSSVPINRNSEQFLWIQRQLDENPARCTLATIHHPFESSGHNGPNPWLRDVWGLLHSKGVEMVVAAHDHLYERLAPMDADQRADPAKGVRQFIAGTGGAPLYSRGRTAANSEALVQQHGVLRLKLEPTLYEWQFVAVNGATLDQGVSVCH